MPTGRRLRAMRPKMIHICAALAAAVVLFLAFIAMGIAVMSGLAALLAAGLVALIVYRVVRNGLMAQRLSSSQREVVPPPSA